MKVPITYKSDILDDLDNLGVDGVWKLRGNVNMLKNHILQNPAKGDKIILDNIESLLDVSNNLYNFYTNIKESVTSADFNKMARLFNTGGDSVQAIEEIMTAEDISIPEIIMSGLSIILTYVGNTAFVTSALESCETLVSATSIVVYDKLWALVHNYRSDPTPQELRKINDTMNAFFSLFPNRDIPLTERVMLITRLYQLLCMVYIAGILKNITWVQEA
ncbi:MAG: hypothetical protein KAJ51_08440 [Thermoplasmata archaeon]|nr:hypothetical protein [Thermoplasmata archaeon]